MDFIHDLMMRWDSLKGRHNQWEWHWKEIAELCWSSNDAFYQGGVSVGETRKQRVFSDAATLALTKFAALCESILVPRDQSYHQLRHPSEDMMRNPEVEQYFYKLNETLFRYRYDPKANFQAQIHECWMSLGAYGTCGIFVDEDPDGGIRYRSNWIGDLYIDVNHQGMVDTTVRRFDFDARKAEQKWGRETLPQAVIRKLDASDYSQDEYIHFIAPSQCHPGAKTDKKFMSVYLHTESGTIVSQGGYDTFPNPVSRYETSPNENYGRGPGSKALASIQTINAMERDGLRASHMAVAPPLLLSDDGILTGGRSNMNINPNGMIYNGIGSDGQRRVDYLQTGARPDLLDYKIDSRERKIREAFLNDYFSLIDETKRLTATESLMREQKEGALIGPLIGRQTTELLEPIIMREISLLDKQGLLPEVPSVLADDMNFEIVFDSPLTRARGREKLVGINRLIEAASALAPIDGGMSARSLNSREIMRYIRLGEGVPPDAIKSDEAIEEEMSAELQTRQAQQVIQAAPGVAKARRDSAQAEQIRSQ